MQRRACAWMIGLGAATGCVPPGNAEVRDAGTSPPAVLRPGVVAPSSAPAFAAADLLKAPFEDNFDRPPSRSPVESDSAATEVGPDWMVTAPGIWHIEGGRLCGEHARNHGVWLRRALPLNARIEFDGVSLSPDGDLKAEYWGDGRSFAKALSYTDATSYLTIFGGWHNKFHVLARLNEHGNDRQEIDVDPTSDDPREKPVVTGQTYHFKVERSDGRSVRWWIDGVEMLTFADTTPLTGPGHDHFGFNDWEVKVCFDSVRVVPLP